MKICKIVIVAVLVLLLGSSLMAVAWRPHKDFETKEEHDMRVTDTDTEDYSHFNNMNETSEETGDVKVNPDRIREIDVKAFMDYAEITPADMSGKRYSMLNDTEKLIEDVRDDRFNNPASILQATLEIADYNQDETELLWSIESEWLDFSEYDTDWVEIGSDYIAMNPETPNKDMTKDQILSAVSTDSELSGTTSNFNLTQPYTDKSGDDRWVDVNRSTISRLGVDVTLSDVVAKAEDNTRYNQTVLNRTEDILIDVRDNRLNSIAEVLNVTLEVVNYNYTQFNKTWNLLDDWLEYDNYTSEWIDLVEHELKLTDLEYSDTLTKEETFTQKLQSTDYEDNHTLNLTQYWYNPYKDRTEKLEVDNMTENEVYVNTTLSGVTAKAEDSSGLTQQYLEDGEKVAINVSEGRLNTLPEVLDVTLSITDYNYTDFTKTWNVLDDWLNYSDYNDEWVDLVEHQLNMTTKDAYDNMTKSETHTLNPTESSQSDSSALDLTQDWYNPNTGTTETTDVENMTEIRVNSTLTNITAKAEDDSVNTIQQLDSGESYSDDLKDSYLNTVPEYTNVSLDVTKDVSTAGNYTVYDNWSENFESNTSGDFTFNHADMDTFKNPNMTDYSAGIESPNTDIDSPTGGLAETDVSPHRYQSFEFYWNETTSSQGGGVRVLSENGNPVLGFATDNPQWVVSDADGQTEIYTSSDYKIWTKVKFDINWSNYTYQLEVKTIDDSHVETHSGDLNNSNDLQTSGSGIGEVMIDNYNGGFGHIGWGSDGHQIEMWFDSFSLKYNKTYRYGGISESFEDNTTGVFSPEVTAFKTYDKPSYGGDYSAGAEGYLDKTIATTSPDIQPQKYDTFEFYWNESSSSYGGGIELLDSEGDHVVSFATDNPEWMISDGESGSGFDGLNVGDGYDRWIHVKFDFNWDNHSYEYNVKDLKSGTTESGERALDTNADNISAINIKNYDSFGWGTSEFHMWFDDISLTYEATVNYTLEGTEYEQNTTVVKDFNFTDIEHLNLTSHTDTADYDLDYTMDYPLIYGTDVPSIDVDYNLLDSSQTALLTKSEVVKYGTPTNLTFTDTSINQSEYVAVEITDSLADNLHTLDLKYTDSTDTDIDWRKYYQIYPDADESWWSSKMIDVPSANDGSLIELKDYTDSGQHYTIYARNSTGDSFTPISNLVGDKHDQIQINVTLDPNYPDDSYLESLTLNFNETSEQIDFELMGNSYTWSDGQTDSFTYSDVEFLNLTSHTDGTEYELDYSMNYPKLVDSEVPSLEIDVRMSIGGDTPYTHKYADVKYGSTGVTYFDSPPYDYDTVVLRFTNYNGLDTSETVLNFTDGVSTDILWNHSDTYEADVGDAWWSSKMVDVPDVRGRPLNLTGYSAEGMGYKLYARNSTGQSYESIDNFIGTEMDNIQMNVSLYQKDNAMLWNETRDTGWSRCIDHINVSGTHTVVVADGNTVYGYDYDTRNILWSYQHDSTVKNLRTEQFNYQTGDPEIVISGDNDGNWIIYRITDNTILEDRTDYTGQIRGLGYDYDIFYIGYGYDTDRVLAYDFSSGTVDWSYSSSYELQSLDNSYDEVVYGKKDGEITWLTESGSHSKTIDVSQRYSIPDTPNMFDIYRTGIDGGTVYFGADTTFGKVEKSSGTIRMIHDNHTGYIRSIDTAVIDGHRYWYTAGSNGKVIAYNSSSGNVDWSHDLHGDAEGIAHGDVDGRNVVFSCSDDQFIAYSHDSINGNLKELTLNFKEKNAVIDFDIMGTSDTIGVDDPETYNYTDKTDLSVTSQSNETTYNITYRTEHPTLTDGNVSALDYSLNVLDDIHSTLLDKSGTAEYTSTESFTFTDSSVQSLEYLEADVDHTGLDTDNTELDFDMDTSIDWVLKGPIYPSEEQTYWVSEMETVYSYPLVLEDYTGVGDHYEIRGRNSTGDSFTSISNLVGDKHEQIQINVTMYGDESIGSGRLDSLKLDFKEDESINFTMMGTTYKNWHIGDSDTFTYSDVSQLNLTSHTNTAEYNLTYTAQYDTMKGDDVPRVPVTVKIVDSANNTLKTASIGVKNGTSAVSTVGSEKTDWSNVSGVRISFDDSGVKDYDLDFSGGTVTTTIYWSATYTDATSETHDMMASANFWSIIVALVLAIAVGVSTKKPDVAGMVFLGSIIFFGLAGWVHHLMVFITVLLFAGFYAIRLKGNTFLNR